MWINSFLFYQMNLKLLELTLKVNNNTLESSLYKLGEQKVNCSS